MKMSYNEEESSSSSDSDGTGFEEDMEALRKACSVTGGFVVDGDDDLPELSSDDEDIQLLRTVQQRFGDEQKPLNSILPSYLEDDDDFETLRAIQRRFSHNNNNNKNNDSSINNNNNNCIMKNSLQRSEQQVGATNIIDSGIKSSPNFFLKSINNGQGFPDCVDGRPRPPNQNFDIPNVTPDNPYANASQEHRPHFEFVSVTKDGGFPRSAQAFVDAINKNRACRKFIRNKVIQIEAKMEENKNLRERAKIMKDFVVACKKRTTRALSRKKDALIQLISIPKQNANASKIKDKSAHAFCQGPAENLQVARYREAMSRYPFSFRREPWSKEEKENLLKGIKQQFQEMLMQKYFSGEVTDFSAMDSMIEKIRDRKITPKEIRLFLPKVSWEHLASMYVTGRSGRECQSRWINCDDLLINRELWTPNEDKQLLHIVSNRGMSNWVEIAKELKTDRTPFQCLSRFQRSLNTSIIKNEWTPPEDEELRKAVAEYGETNWQAVTSTLEGRTGTQCSNRWTNSLNPRRERVGKWDPEEDKRLKISVRLFGAKNWKNIAKFVSGRTQVQCRERWVNCLDPSLNMNVWTEEEDLKLKAAIEEYGYCWSRIAACIPPRTDNQCWRRWKVLLPHQVSLQQVARKMKKAAFISNFVDREGERPNLTVNDFISPPLTELDPEASEDHISSNNEKLRTTLKARPKRTRKVNHTEDVSKSIDKDSDITNHSEGPKTFNGGNFEIKKKATGKLKGKERIIKIKSKNKPQKSKTKASTSSADTGNCKIEKKTNGKRKRKQRTVVKTRLRKARKVTPTEKTSILTVKDDVENNDGHADITSKNVAATAFCGDKSEIKKNVTRKRKRKQRGNKEEDDESDETWEPESVSKKTTLKPCSRVSRDHRAILTNESSLIDPNSMCRSSDDTLINEHCSSAQVKTLRRSKRNHNGNDPKVSRVRSSGTRRNEKKVVQLEDEETLGSFLSKLKNPKNEENG